MRKILFTIVFISSIALQSQSFKYDKSFPLEDYNFVLGTNSLGSNYKFSNDSKIIEQAKQTRALGSNILKISITNRKLKQYGYVKSDADDMMDVLDLIPDYEKAMKMDFKYFFFWFHTATGIKWKKGIDEKQEKRLVMFFRQPPPRATRWQNQPCASARARESALDRQSCPGSTTSPGRLRPDRSHAIVGRHPWPRCGRRGSTDQRRNAGLR